MDVDVRGRRAVSRVRKRGGRGEERDEGEHASHRVVVVVVVDVVNGRDVVALAAVSR